MSDADALQAELGADAETAIQCLLLRAKRLQLRARRTRVDSNERHKTEGQWRSVQACARAIVTDKDLREHLRARGLLVDAWLPLNNAIAEWQKKGKQ